MLVSYSWAWGLFWSVIEILSEISLENTDFFPLCQWVSITNSFFVQVETLSSLHSLYFGTPSGLYMCRSCEHHHSLSEFMCEPVLLCLQSTVDS